MHWQDKVRLRKINSKTTYQAYSKAVVCTSMPRKYPCKSISILQCWRYWTSQFVHQARLVSLHFHSSFCRFALWHWQRFIKDIPYAGPPLEGCKGSNWPLNFWERLNCTHRFWKICDILTPFWKIADTLTPQFESIAEALRYRPIAYFFLGLYIGIGLLSKIR